MKEMMHRLSILASLALAAAVAVPSARGAEHEIGSLEELQAFMEAVHAEDFAGDTILLTADIDCEGGRFNTGDPEYPTTFSGTFDGQGHVIRNFVHAPTGGGDSGYGVAMFDFTETGAVIQNLTLEGTLPGNYGGAYAAPFVLAAEGPLSLVMDNCHFRGAVTNHYYAAGLVGYASNAVFRASTAAVDIAWDVTHFYLTDGRAATWNFCAIGGAAGVTLGDSAFHDCAVVGKINSLYGHA